MFDNINRLLIVDSDADVAEQIRSSAEEIGFAVADANHLLPFLELVDEFRPTAILMDMDLPQTDGVEALRALASRDCKAEILLMGKTDRRVLATTMNLGQSRGLAMSGMLSKPLVLQDLQTCLTQVYIPDRQFRAADILEALEGEQFVAYYQPKVSLVETGGWFIDGVEALVRWQHPTLGLVMPDEFIPQSEEFGLIGRLTEQVLAQSLTQVRLWQDAGLSLKCSVNLPPSLVNDLYFPDRVAHALLQHGVEPSQLCLELTETATMQDPTTSMDILTRLRVKGMGLSLDDFGTGYSSLTRLYHMPFDEMKIDKSLVMNVPRSREANTIVGSLIELGHNLGLKICAEGVESRAALDLLEVLRADRCQGYFISRALPADDISNFVSQWNNESPASAQRQPAGAAV